MATNAPPSVDPANEGNLGGMFGELMKKYMQRTDGMLPARVISYDRTTNVATVQPQIMVLTTENGTVSRAQIASVPVLALGGGGFFLNFPLKPGDTGWIEASDRDISLYVQGQGARETGPNTLRMHSFEDGRFIPDKMSAYTIGDEDGESVVLQSADGAVCVALSLTRVTLRAPEEIRMEAPLIRMQASAIAMEGEDGSTATVTATGNFNFAGGTFTHNGKNVGSTHTHGGVQTGGGTSGAPT